MTRVRVPRLGIIFGGVNDPGSSITQGQTQANIEAMIQTLFDAGAAYAMVVSPQYLYWTTGGDSTSQTKPGGTYGSVYDAQVAAVAARAAANTAKSVAFCDLWTWMKGLIVGGAEPTPGTAAWHVQDTNQHFNAKGHRYVRDAVLATIQAQSGWVAALANGS
jgi:lysophospholipase L1-like esterase